MKKLVFEMCLLALLALTTDFAKCTDEDSDYSIQEFLSEYESRIRYPEGYKDVVLVMGNTGSGKTTFTQWIAGDNSKLLSVEVGKDTGEYIIIDNNRIGNSTTVSKTIYPEFVEDYDPETGKVRNGYYDLPGFADSRGVKYDIASSYFIKRILEDCSDPKICHITRIKILLVVNYSSVRFGVDRKSLKRLLTHVTELLKDSDRYLDGIGLVVTKVENISIMGRDGSFHLVSDNATISNVAAFLRDVEADIENEVKLSKLMPSKESIGNKSKALLNALASNSYERIALFRRPYTAGSLDKIAFFQEGKQRINFVIENLKPILRKNDDFGYTVSDATKIRLYNEIDATKAGLERNIEALSNDLDKQYTNKINIIYYKIDHEVNIHDMTAVHDVINDIQKLRNELKESYSEIYKLAQQLEHVEHFKLIPTLIKDALSHLNLNVSQRLLLDISIQANFLDFLKESLSLKIDTIPLSLAVQNTGHKIDQLCQHVDVGISRLAVEIDERIKSDINSTFFTLRREFDSHEIGAYDLQVLQNATISFCNKITEAQKLSDPTEKLQKFNQSIETYKIFIPQYILHDIKDEKYFSFFTQQMDLFVAHMLDCKAWYIFLNKLYIKLTTYGVQSAKTAQEHCRTFVQDSANYEGKKVKDTNIGFILQHCDSNLYDHEYDHIKFVVLTGSKIQLLEKVINYTINDNIVTQSCNGTRLIVRGHFVKFSDINIYACKSITHFQVFVAEKLFIDRDLDFSGRSIQVSVMAPTWEVVGIRKIILDGLPGITGWASDEVPYGMPGAPGGHAGDFFGYGDKFVNGQNLLISANGGNGGPGVYGRDGKDGINGEIPDLPQIPTYLDSWNENYTINYWSSKNFTFSDIRRCEGSDDDCIKYDVIGTPCTDGEDGGMGGAGGMGGLAGTVRVFFDAPFSIKAFNGSQGADGSPGAVGRAGAPQGKMTVKQTTKSHLFYADKSFATLFHRELFCKNGQFTLHKNTEGGEIAMPKPTFINEESTCNEFRTYLEDNLESTMRRNILSKFLQRIDRLSLR